MTTKKAKFAGVVIGLLAAALSVGRVLSDKIPDLGKLWIPVGACVILTLSAISWKVTRGWLVPTFLCMVTILSVASYFIRDFLLSRAHEDTRLVTMFWVSMAVDATIVLLSAVWLLLQIRGWLKWLRENGSPDGQGN